MTYTLVFFMDALAKQPSVVIFYWWGH